MGTLTVTTLTPFISERVTWKDSPARGLQSIDDNGTSASCLAAGWNTGQEAPGDQGTGAEEWLQPPSLWPDRRTTRKTILKRAPTHQSGEDRYRNTEAAQKRKQQWEQKDSWGKKRGQVICRFWWADCGDASNPCTEEEPRLTTASLTELGQKLAALWLFCDLTLSPGWSGGEAWVVLRCFHGSSCWKPVPVWELRASILFVPLSIATRTAGKSQLCRKYAVLQKTDMNLGHKGKENRGKGNSGHGEWNPDSSNHTGSQDETDLAKLDKREIWNRKAFSCSVLSDTPANVHKDKWKGLEGDRFEIKYRSTKRPQVLDLHSVSSQQKVYRYLVEGFMTKLLSENHPHSCFSPLPPSMLLFFPLLWISVLQRKALFKHIILVY